MYPTRWWASYRHGSGPGRTSSLCLCWKGSIPFANPRYVAHLAWHPSWRAISSRWAWALCLSSRYRLVPSPGEGSWHAQRRTPSHNSENLGLCTIGNNSRNVTSPNQLNTVNVEEFSVHRVPPMPCIQNRKKHKSPTNPLYTEGSTSCWCVRCRRLQNPQSGSIPLYTGV